MTGEALFTRESGAVAAQFHDPPAIEPYASELVGAERGIVLGKKSGIDSIRIALERLGLDVPADRQAELLAAVKALGTKHQRLVTDAELPTAARRRRQEAPMARELVNPPDLHPAPGFSHIAIAEGTRVVHLAGQLGLDPDFSLAADDLHGQTVKAMRNVEVATRARPASAGTTSSAGRSTRSDPTAYEVITRRSTR